MGSYPPQGYPVAAPPAVDTRGNTIVVAASNSIDPTLAPPAYRCDGTADQAEINNAIIALGATGGAVILLEGQYNISGQINLATGTALMGQGRGTVLRVPNGHNVAINMIVGSGIDRVLIKDLMVDGNRANQAAGVMHGIYFDTVTYSKVESCWVEGLRDDGIHLQGSSDYNTITGNTCRDNYAVGIYVASSDSNTIDGNTCEGNGPTGHGIWLASSDYNTVVGNVSSGNREGIYLTAACNSNTIDGNTCEGNADNGINLSSTNYNTVVGNTCYENGDHGIKLAVSDNNTVVGNAVVSNSQSVNNLYDGIIINGSSSYNNVQCNMSRRGVGANQQRYGISVDDAAGTGNVVVDNDIYLGGVTANFSDAGTGTVVRSNRGWVTENNVLSPTFAIDAVAVVTVTIPHGLNVTPAVEDCQLTVVEDTDVDDWEEGYHKVESVGAANVVAKVNVTAASATGGATAKLALHVDLAGG